MAETLSSQHTTEIARAPRPLWGLWGGTPRINAHIARSEGFAESAAGAGGHGVYALFEEMEDKDAHLFSILQTRKNGVLARPRKIEPASGSTRDREICDWLKGTLRGLRNWEGAIGHLLDSLAKGMAVVEVIWGFDAEGMVIPVDLKPRHAGRFAFGPDGALFLRDAGFGPIGRVERTGRAGDENRGVRSIGSASARSNGAAAGSTSTFGRRLPDRKFATMVNGATDERPHGRGLDERVYWYWWFKKNNLKFWVLYNEKFGAPTVVARHSPGLSSEERERLLDVITSLQVDAGVTIPEGISLELLESKRSGSADTYRELANWCNDEMSRAVLGQTLTVGEGQRSGSLALAKVHQSVRFDYIKTDACLLMESVNSQLIRWMIDFNFGPEVPAPRWEIDLTPEVELKNEAEIDRQLIQMGVPLPLRYFYTRYGRPEPAEGERQLRYDDNNLFQYHLEFGILTVNEVRTSLGLPPVEGGDRPPAPMADRSTLPTPRAAIGADRPESESESEEELEREREV